MSKIKIIGLGWLDIPAGQALYLDESVYSKEEVGNDQSIVFNGYKGTKGDIKGFIHAEPEVDKNFAFREQNQKSQDEYMSWRRETLHKSPVERAKTVTFFLLIHKSTTSEKISEEEVDKAIALQVTFYKENPRRCLPDPQIFKELLHSRGIGFGMVQMIMSAVNQDRGLALKNL